MVLWQLDTRGVRALEKFIYMYVGVYICMYICVCIYIGKKGRVVLKMRVFT